MKLAESLARYIESLGIRHVFGVSGGASLHLIHGIADATKVQFIPTTHECNAGFAADAYARLTGLGVALATSGPGATNLVTAIATSFYDSVPVLYITGNVATHRASASLQVRQYGFQDAPICEIVRSITKSAISLRSGRDLWQVARLVASAKDGRPGPVLVDIPDDLQRADVPDIVPPSPPREERRAPVVGPVMHLLKQSNRPVFVWGAGMRGAQDQARELAEVLQVPVAGTAVCSGVLAHRANPSAILESNAAYS
jgi:acetolactate synthase-1/2/3 large subunit